jgi:hypothetical protein
MKYEPHILRMQEFIGFYDQWCSLIGYYQTHLEAYEATERMYENYFGKRRYKNFETFKVLVSRHFKCTEVSDSSQS